MLFRSPAGAPVLLIALRAAMRAGNLRPHMEPEPTTALIMHATRAGGVVIRSPAELVLS